MVANNQSNEFAVKFPSEHHSIKKLTSRKSKLQRMKTTKLLTLFFAWAMTLNVFAAPAQVQTILLWPEVPPGALPGDAEKAQATAAAIEQATHKPASKNRRDIRVPTIDVYLPAKDKNTGVAMVIFSGGGYGAVCIGSEGLPMKKFLNDNGIAVFMVSYRCSPFNHPVPLWDAQRAVRTVRSRAKEFGVEPDKIGVMGFSAGGHEAATLSVHYDNAFGYIAIDAIDKISARPDFSCLIYPVISMRNELTHAGSQRNLLGATPAEELLVKLSNDEQINKKTPPAFLAHGTADKAVQPENSKRYHQACKKHGVATKLVLVKGGVHGPAMLNGKPAINKTNDEYADSMLKWIKKITAPLQVDTIAENLHDPMELALAPDGSIYVIEREGRVLRVNPATGGMFAIGTVPVTALRNTDRKSKWAREDGLLGLALAPDFATSQQLYLYFSHPEKLLNRLSRFTLKDGLLDLASELVLLDVKTDRRDTVCHQAGSLQFGPDGLLYLSTGDNTNPFESDGKAPIDDRDGRDHTDAMRSAGNTNDLRGKILRIRPTANGYEIPAGNLFKPGTPKTRPEIFVMGCRNPFRISIDPKTKYVYWGEVGPDSRKVNDKGPMGYDEVNQARAAGNFGWPFVIADNQPYPIVDFDKGTPGTLTDPAAPRNPGQRNTGLEILPPAQKAFIWYPYTESKEFPAMKTGGRNAMAGPVFYYDPTRKNNILPREDDHSLLTYDWMRGRIWKAGLDKDDRFTSLEEIASDLRHPMDIEMDKDGSLWLLEYGSGWYFNKNGRVRHILPSGHKPAPSIEIEATPGAPRSWQVKSSSDLANDKITIQWWLTVGTGETMLGSGSNITIPADTGSELRAVAIDANGTRSIARLPLQGDTSERPLELELTADHLAPGGELGFKVKGLADPSQVTVRLRYIPPSGHDAGSISFAAPIEQTLNRRLCFSCHQTDAKSIGPRYTDVALRYKGKKGALDTLKQKLKSGGAGAWGEIPMPPQHTITDPEADQVLRAILGLGQSLTEQKGSAEGSLQAPATIVGHEPGGAWEITAEAPNHHTATLRIADK